jgi:hypothetical protein
MEFQEPLEFLYLAGLAGLEGCGTSLFRAREPRPRSSIAGEQVMFSLSDRVCRALVGYSVTDFSKMLTVLVNTNADHIYTICESSTTSHHMINSPSRPCCEE